MGIELPDEPVRPDDCIDQIWLECGLIACVPPYIDCCDYDFFGPIWNCQASKYHDRGLTVNPRYCIIQLDAIDCQYIAQYADYFGHYTFAYCSDTPEGVEY